DRALGQREPALLGQPLPERGQQRNRLPLAQGTTVLGGRVAGAERAQRACPGTRGEASRAHVLRSRIVRTGQGGSGTVLSATEPGRAWLRPVRPWVAITISSMASSAA